ncbi:hypothetical protein EG834_05735 [bacterium]|nr:hypothetical protein [bacterium]
MLTGSPEAFQQPPQDVRRHHNHSAPRAIRRTTINNYFQPDNDYAPPDVFVPLPPHDQLRPKHRNVTIHNAQHFEVQDLFLRIARYEIIVVSPWIRGNAAYEFARSIPEQHEHGVRVRVYYGWRPVKKSGYYDDSDVELVDMYRQLLGPDMVRVTGGTHSKLLICDRRGAAITSWNWLSHQYRGHGKERSEDGIYTTDTRTIDRLLATLKIGVYATPGKEG